MPNVILSLICHAPTQAVRDVSFPADEPLDPQGLAAAMAFAGNVRRVDAALTSPYLRARQTAAALKLEALIEPALRELDYGRWTGRRLCDIESANPEGAAAWLSDTSAAPHGGESIDALLARTKDWLATVVQRESRIVAVTHASILRAALVAVLKASPASFWRIDVPPLCRLRLRGASGQWTLLSIR